MAVLIRKRMTAIDFEFDATTGDVTKINVTVQHQVVQDQKQVHTVTETVDIMPDLNQQQQDGANNFAKRVRQLAEG